MFSLKFKWSKGADWGQKASAAIAFIKASETLRKKRRKSRVGGAAGDFVSKFQISLSTSICPLKRTVTAEQDAGINK
jgi:hypothetical protein